MTTGATVSRTVRVGPVRVTLEVPQAVARPLRRVRDMFAPPAAPVPAPVPEPPASPAPEVAVATEGGIRLVVADPPALEPHFPPDPEAAAAMFQNQRVAEESAAHAAEGAAGAAAAGGSKTLAQEVADLPWYHTIELPGGVVTAGVFDHRPLLPHYGLPESLAGLRVLDVGTADGFWAFEMERRGAAEVVASDIPSTSHCDMPPPMHEAFLRGGYDRPSRLGFDVAHRARSSKVQWVESAVYDLNPDTLGTFDLVHAGDLLLHVERPHQALRAIRSVTRGRAVISDVFSPLISGTGMTRYFGGWHLLSWWEPSLDTLVQMTYDAGFSKVDIHTTYMLAPAGEELGQWRAVLLAEV